MRDICNSAEETFIAQVIFKGFSYSFPSYKDQHISQYTEQIIIRYNESQYRGINIKRLLIGLRLCRPREMRKQETKWLQTM